MDAITINLAYKFVASMMMLAEANFFCAQTGLSPHRVFAENDIRDGSHVGPAAAKDFGGSILTDEYFFGFGWGHLANFYKRGFMPKTDVGIKQRNAELAKLSSLIDTNGAIELATNWLASLGANVPRLETKYRRNVIQWRFYPNGLGGQAVELPVFQVEWRGFLKASQTNRGDRAMVSVTIFGTAKELVEYHVLDDSIFLRRPLMIKNREKLLSIPDDEFRKRNPVERAELVSQFDGSDEPEALAPPSKTPP